MQRYKKGKSAWLTLRSARDPRLPWSIPTGGLQRLQGLGRLPCCDCCQPLANNAAGRPPDCQSIQFPRAGRLNRYLERSCRHRLRASLSVRQQASSASIPGQLVRKRPDRKPKRRDQLPGSISRQPAPSGSPEMALRTTTTRPIDQTLPRLGGINLYLMINGFPASPSGKDS